MPTNPRQTTLVGADDWRDETGLATWLANLVRYTLYCEAVGVVLRAERARRPRLVATAGVAPGRASAWWDQLCADIPDLDAGNESISRSRSTGLHAVRENDDTFVPDSTSRRVVRLVLPLLTSERRLGALIVEFRFGKRVMPDVLLRTRALAQLVALALDHGRLMDEREAWANTVGQLRRDSENTEAALMQIVHELRGPLTTMKLGTQIAQRQLKRVADSRMVTTDSSSTHVARATTALTLADRNANMAERLLSDLADITRIRVGIAETHTARCDLGEIVHNSVAGQRLVWRRRIIHLESPTEAIPVIADADRVTQVVSNYLSNALRYSPNVQPVEVRLERGDGEARVAVCDHGIGIAPESQQRVWERFYRTSGSSSYSAEGLGVGLFICRQLVEQMGGRVGLESVLGEGSTFWFTVPLATT
ncbi:MAG TPA: HAMP domain-containing sensor histidine kinase [Ktedonobacterales bacterium]|nr:HAMP domain-containing sensor histidine kinase [Ktedonobacterales bacterium]